MQNEATMRRRAGYAVATVAVFFAMFLISTAVAHAAPAHVSTVSTDSDSTGRSGTSNTYVTSGSDVVLLISVVWGAESDVTLPAANVTYDSQALVSVNKQCYSASNRCMEVFERKLLPAEIGSKTYQVTWSGPVDYSNVTLSSYSGANDVNLTTDVGATGLGTIPTVDITPGAATSMLVAFADGSGGDTDPFAPGLGVTWRTDGATGTGTEDYGPPITFTRAQPEVVAEGINPSALFTPTAGNLLVAIAFERSGTNASFFDISPGTWAKHIADDTENGNPDARRTLIVWAKVSDGSETTIQVTGSSNTTKLMVQEFSAGTPVTWNFEGQMSGDTGTGTTGPLPTGSTGSIGEGDLLLIGAGGWRREGTNNLDTISWTSSALSSVINDIGGNNGRSISSAYAQESSGGTKATTLDWNGSGHEATAGILVYSATVVTNVDDGYWMGEKAATVAGSPHTMNATMAISDDWAIIAVEVTEAAAGAISQVQTKSADFRGSAPSVTLDSAATAGNLLVATLGGRNGTSIPPSGWHTAMTDRTDDNATLFYKIAAGGETTITFTSTPRGGIWVGEYSASSGWPANPLDAVVGSECSGVTCATGNVVTSTADALLVASFGLADGSEFTDARSYSNSFTDESWEYSGTGGTEGTGMTAARIVTSTGTYSTTLDTTGSMFPTGGMASAFAAFKTSDPSAAFAQVYSTGEDDDFDASGTNHTVTMPETIASGDMIFIGFSSDSGVAIGWPAGWDEIVEAQEGSVTLAAGYKVSDGTEGGTSVTVTTSTIQETTSAVYVIKGASTSVAPVGATATGNSANPDPPNLAPVGGSDDYLWIAFASVDGGGIATTVIPTGFGEANLEVVDLGEAAGASTHMLGREETAASKNPDAFTIGSADNWAAATIAVYPAGAGGGGVTKVQEKTGNCTSCTSVTATLTSAPTSGNVLIAGLFAREPPAIIETSGWTLAEENTDSGANDALELWYRIADGNEGAGYNVTATFLSDNGASILWVSEWSGFTNAAFDVSAQGAVDTAMTQTSGTTVATAEADSWAIAVFSSRNNEHNTTGFGNGFTETYDQTFAAGGFASNMHGAVKTLTETGTQESTATLDSSGGRAMGTIAVFSLGTVDGGPVTVNRVRSASNDGAGPITATFGATPTQGNLLIAASMHRQYLSSPTISGTGWTRALNHCDSADATDCPTQNSSWRRGIAVWYKIAGASEPPGISTQWDGGTQSNRIVIQEFEIVGGGTFTFDVSATGDSDQTTVSSQITGTTVASAQANSLLITHMATRGDTGAFTSWTNGVGSNLPNTGSSRTIHSGFGVDSTQGTKESTASWTNSVAAIGNILVFSVVGANTAPTITGPGCSGSAFSDLPDPQTVGGVVDFCADWDDVDAGDTNVDIYVCKTDSVTPGTGCDSAGWVSVAATPDDPENDSLGYTTLAGDVGTSPNSYYIFVCDDEPTCSASSSGTFTVNAANTAPTITGTGCGGSAFSDSPDPQNELLATTFCIGWSDADGDQVKVHACKSNLITPSATGGSCDGGSWASTSALTLTDPKSETYTTQTGDIGPPANNYWVFVCDDDAGDPLCSGAGGNSGTFDVNDTPVHDASVIDDGDNVLEGNNVIFTVDWSDTDDSTTAITIYVCDTTGITPGTGCDGTTYASKNNPLDPTGSSDLVYLTTETDSGAGPISYNAYICDNNSPTPLCSAASPGVFTVDEQTLNIDFLANGVSSLSGPDPLNVTLEGFVLASGTAVGTINYSFWWDCTDSGTDVGTVEGLCGSLPVPPGCNAFGCKYDGVGPSSGAHSQTTDSHTYDTSGSPYTAKVIIERGLKDPPVTATVPITVSATPPPTVTTNDATVTGQTTATISGEANPNGFQTNGWFRYKAGTGLVCNDADGIRIPGAGVDDLSDGTSIVQIDDPEDTFRLLTGLTANMTYSFCAIAENENPSGKVFGAVKQFTTNAPSPIEVTTEDATSVLSFSATLNGKANPNGAQTDGFFKYKADANPGSCGGAAVWDSTSSTTNIGDGTIQVDFSRSISGLSASKTYYYCAFATNSGGETNAQAAGDPTYIHSFTTPASSNNPPSVTGSIAPNPSNKPDRVLAFGDTYASMTGLDTSGGNLTVSPECEVAPGTVGVVQTDNDQVTDLADITATYAPAATSGNLLVAIHSARGQNMPPEPAGWSAAVQDTRISGRGSVLGIYYKISDGTEAAVTFMLSAAEDQVLVIMEIEGAVTSGVLDQTINTVYGTIQNSFSTGTTAQTSQANEIAIAAAMIEDANGGGTNGGFNFSWTNGFYLVDFDKTVGDISLSTGMRILNAAGTYETTESFVPTDEGQAAMATFNLETSCAAGGGGGGTPNAALAAEPERWISHIDDTAADIGVAEYVQTEGTCDDTDWNCDTAHEDAIGSAIAIAPDGSVSMVYVESPSPGAIYIADYVGSGGSGCASSAWTCTLLNSTNTYRATDLNLVVGPDGKRWIVAYRTSVQNMLTVIYEADPGEVGSCANTAWDCDEIKSNPKSVFDIAIDAFGDAWVAYGASPGMEIDLYAAKYVETGGTGCEDSEWNCELVWSELGLANSWTMGIDIDPITNIPRIITPGSNTDGSDTDGFVVARRDGGGTGCPVGGDPAWTCEVVATVGGVSDAAIAIANDGTVWAAIHDTTDLDLTVLRYEGDGSGNCAPGNQWTCWGVATTGSQGADMDIAINTDGNPWVSYRHMTNQDLMLAVYVGSGGSGCDDGAWTCSIVDDFITTLAGYDSSIAISNQNDFEEHVWVAHYDDGTDDLLASHYVGGKGNCDTFGDGGSDQWDCFRIADTAAIAGSASTPAMAIDAHGTPWIAYVDNVNDLYVAWYTGDGEGFGCAHTADWHCRLVSSEGDIDGSSIDAVFDDENHLWIAFYDRTTNGGELKVANHRYEFRDNTGGCGAATWSRMFNCDTVDSGAGVGVGVAIALNPTTGYPWVSYTDDTNNELFVARYAGEDLGVGCDSLDWTCEQVHGAAGATSIDISPSGAVWVSFQTTSLDLGVANNVGAGESCTDTDWNCETVDTGTNMAPSSSIQWSSGFGYPWVYYYDASSGDLIIARRKADASCADPDWECDVEDATGDRGAYPSFQYDSAGLRWTAYQDATNGDLWIIRDVLGTGSGCSVSTSSDCYRILSVAGGAVGHGASLDVRTTRVAAISQVQKISAGSVGDEPTVTATYPNTPKEGNMLIAIHAHDDSNPATPPLGWATAAEFSSPGGTSRMGIYYKLAGASEATAVTFKIDNDDHQVLSIFEYQGIAESSPLDKTSVYPDGSANQEMEVTPKTEQADELIIVGAFKEAETTWDEGWAEAFIHQTEIVSTGGGSGDRIDMTTAHRIARERDNFSTENSTTANEVGVGIIATFRAKTGSVPAGPRIESLNGYTSGNSNKNIHTLDRPAGVEDDDILYVTLSMDGGPGITTILPPTGWTEVYHELRLDNAEGISGLWYKVITDAGSEPDTYDFTLEANSRGGGVMIRVSGADTSNPVSVSLLSTGIAPQPIAPSVTTTEGNSLVVRVVSVEGRENFYFPPSGHEAIYDYSRGDVAGAASGTADYYLQATAGATGTANYVSGSSVDAWEALTLVIPPGSDGGSGGGGIVFDNTEYAECVATSTCTLSNFTLGGGSNRMVIISAAIEGTEIVTGVTFNGDPASLIGTASFTDMEMPPHTQYVGLWAIEEANLPVAGDYDVVATWMGVENTSLAVASYSGVARVIPSGVQTDTNGGDDVASLSTTVTAPADDSLIFTVGNHGDDWDAFDYTTGSSPYVRVFDVRVGGDTTYHMGVQNAMPFNNNSSTSIVTTLNSSGPTLDFDKRVVMVTAAFAPASAQGTPTSIYHDNTDLVECGSASTCTLSSFALGTGENRMVLVSTNEEESLNDVTDVQVDGVSATEIAFADSTDGGGSRTEMWAILESNLPAAGSYDIDVTWAAPPNNPTVAVVSLINTEQVIPSGAQVDTASVIGASTISTTVTTPEADSLIYSAAGHGDGNGDWRGPSTGTLTPYVRQWYSVHGSKHFAGAMNWHPHEDNTASQAVTITETNSLGAYNRATMIAVAIGVIPGAGGGGGADNVTGTIESVTLDTRSPNGVSYNSFLWNGTRPAGSLVRMWLASSNCPNGETDPPECTVPADPRIDEGFSGADNSPWPSQDWTTSTILGGVAEIEFNQGNFEHPAEHNSGARAISTMTPVADSEVLLRYRFGTTSGESHARICLRASGTWFDYDNPTSAYCVRHQNNTATVTLFSYTNSGGTENTLDSAGGFSTQFTWWSLRFQVNEDDIRYRIWPSEQTEPTAWTGEVPGNIHVIGTGVLMISFAENDPMGDDAEEFYMDAIRLRNLDIASAADDDTTSQWRFYGENCTAEVSPYTPVPGVVSDIGCEGRHFNKRYFRYRVQLCEDTSCSLSGSTPTITNLSINRSF